MNRFIHRVIASTIALSLIMDVGRDAVACPILAAPVHPVSFLSQALAARLPISFTPLKDPTAVSIRKNGLLKLRTALRSDGRWGTLIQDGKSLALGGLTALVAYLFTHNAAYAETLLWIGTAIVFLGDHLLDFRRSRRYGFLNVMRNNLAALVIIAATGTFYALAYLVATHGMRNEENSFWGVTGVTSAAFASIHWAVKQLVQRWAMASPVIVAVFAVMVSGFDGAFQFTASDIEIRRIASVLLLVLSAWLFSRRRKGSFKARAAVGRSFA